ncbi:hypothetical protein MCAP1_002788 [Malassezia caprae]|uniref:Major facilitator superfamily (MFS) profile domain-containing protein n=1 Tax=Malassezia caprae TaxID=1381934 RepID=A0AAF0IWE0_9BASI|nr:hypothetical protein MCAP1_002788 [Malassezia caprae]
MLFRRRNLDVGVPEKALVQGNQRFSIRKFGTIFACGAALFMDGYVNNSIGTVNTLLVGLYPDVMDDTTQETLTAIAFAGTVLGMLVFGYYSDAVGRKSGMIISTLIILVFTALSAGSYYKGSSRGMVQMLTAWRFFTGIGIGAEYPTGSVAAAEQSEELPGYFQHGPFIFATNFMIDMGFVIASFVPLVLTWIVFDQYGAKGNNQLIWRLTMGLGVVPCLFVLPFRFLIKQPQLYSKNMIPAFKIPYRLVLKKYWFRLLCISVVWFIYDFITYPFGLYSSIITKHFTNEDASQEVSLGWNVVITCFYIPGSFMGAMLVDTIGPKKCLCLGLTLQIIVGFILTGLFDKISNHIAAFCVVYGLFLSFGEFGPGDNLGLLASKSCATAVKGQFYGIAAAIGKVGAFAGSYAIKSMQDPWKDANGDPTDQLYYTAPFYLGSSLACVSLVLSLFFIHERSANIQAQEDEDFRQFLISEGFDISLMGKDDEPPSYDEKDIGLSSSYTPDPVSAANAPAMATIPMMQ